MNIFLTILDFFLHLDVHLTQLVNDFGIWTYLILFAVIFIETGIVLFPFLPGDSLLFGAGAIAALGALNPFVLFAVLATAAILGDTSNYWIGHFIGPKAFSGKIRFLKLEHLEKTQRFYEKHGGITIFLARFLPIIRTFAPFVAGIGKMSYGHFLAYNVIGGIVWTGGFIFLGYFFGQVPFIQEHFSLLVLALVVIPGLPALIEVLKSVFKKKQPETAAVKTEAANLVPETTEPVTEAASTDVEGTNTKLQ